MSDLDGSPMYLPTASGAVVAHWQFFWKRRSLLARPLLKENSIGSIILENPFYGARKPPEQV